MQITLRKANELSRLALNAANKVEFFSTVNLTVYDEYHPSGIIGEARKKFELACKQKASLVSCSLALRGLIGQANATSGINELIQQRVQKEALERLLLAEILLLEPKTTPSGRRTGAALPVYDDADLLSRKLTELKQKLEYQKTNPPPANGFPEVIPTEIAASIAREEMVTSRKDQLAELAAEKVEIQDKITAKNFGTMITVPDNFVEVLRTEKLIK